MEAALAPRPPRHADVVPRPPLALTSEERATALEVLNAERFVDQAPPAIYATLLDEGNLPLLDAHPVPQLQSAPTLCPWRNSPPNSRPPRCSAASSIEPDRPLT